MCRLEDGLHPVQIVGIVRSTVANRNVSPIYQIFQMEEIIALRRTRHNTNQIHSARWEKLRNKHTNTAKSFTVKLVTLPLTYPSSYWHGLSCGSLWPAIILVFPANKRSWIVLRSVLCGTNNRIQWTPMHDTIYLSVITIFFLLLRRLIRRIRNCLNSKNAAFFSIRCRFWGFCLPKGIFAAECVHLTLLPKTFKCGCIRQTTKPPKPSQKLHTKTERSAFQAHRTGKTVWDMLNIPIQIVRSLPAKWHSIPTDCHAITVRTKMQREKSAGKNVRRTRTSHP